VIICGGETYEYWHGTYFKKSRNIKTGDCVQLDAMFKSLLKAKETIKGDTLESYFLSLNKQKFEQLYQKLESRKIQKQVEFLQEIPTFTQLQKKTVTRMTQFLDKERFLRN
jgi:hypothetical protein